MSLLRSQVLTNRQNQVGVLTLRVGTPLDREWERPVRSVFRLICGDPSIAQVQVGYSTEAAAGDEPRIFCQHASYVAWRGRLPGCTA